MVKKLHLFLFVAFVLVGNWANAQILYTPSNITAAAIPGAQSWFNGGCCGPIHAMNGNGVFGVGMGAIHDAVDNSNYFNKFAISFAYSAAQGQNPATVLPGLDVTFSGAPALTGLAIWNGCFLMPLQGHYLNDGSLWRFNVIISHSGGTANLTGLTLNNSLTDCSGQILNFGGLYNGVTNVRLMGTGAHANFSNPTTGGDRNFYFGEIRGIDNGVFPVVVDRFIATAADAQINLDWDVSQEINNDYFLVEKSVDKGETWQDLAELTSQGDGINHKYTTVDRNPRNGFIYYRLSQIDKNGGQNIHQATTIFWLDTEEEFVVVYPNPVVNDLKFRYIPNHDANLEVQIFDMVGKMQLQKQLPVFAQEEGSLDLSSLANGRYILNVIGDQGETKRTIILKE